MRRLFLFIMCSSLFVLQGCNNDDAAPDLIEVRVLTEICGSAVLQVVSGAVNVPLGCWTDADGDVHHNAFGTFLDPCTGGFPTGDSKTFFVKLIDEVERTNCIVCLALPANMPEQFYPIRIIDP